MICWLQIVYLNIITVFSLSCSLFFFYVYFSFFRNHKKLVIFFSFQLHFVSLTNFWNFVLLKTAQRKKFKSTRFYYIRRFLAFKTLSKSSIYLPTLILIEKYYAKIFLISKYNIIVIKKIHAVRVDHSIKLIKF